MRVSVVEAQLRAVERLVSDNFLHADWLSHAPPGSGAYAGHPDEAAETMFSVATHLSDLENRPRDA